jgi:hypothetical protein
MVYAKTMLQHHVLLALLDHLMVSLASNAREILLLIQTEPDVSNACKVSSQVGIKLPVSNQHQSKLLVMTEKEKTVILASHVMVMKEPKMMDQHVALTLATPIKFFNLMEHVLHALVVTCQVQTNDSVFNKPFVMIEKH